MPSKHRDNLLEALQDLLKALESLHTTLRLILRVNLPEEASAVLWDVRDTPMRPYTSFEKAFHAFRWGVKLQGGPDFEEDEEIMALYTSIADELVMREDAIRDCNQLLNVLQSHR